MSFASHTPSRFLTCAFHQEQSNCFWLRCSYYLISHQQLAMISVCVFSALVGLKCFPPVPFSAIYFPSSSTSQRHLVISLSGCCYWHLVGLFMLAHFWPVTHDHNRWPAFRRVRTSRRLYLSQVTDFYSVWHGECPYSNRTNTIFNPCFLFQYYPLPNT